MTAITGVLQQRAIGLVRAAWPRVADSLRNLKRALRARPSYVFVAEMMHKPATIGAVLPSSGSLARHMADLVDIDGDGMVIELGAGTGVVTQALLDRGLAPSRLLLVEQSDTFVQKLRNRFPDVTVMHGDAACLDRLLPQSTLVDGIVSSLPLRSLPQDVVVAIMAQWRELLAPGKAVIQFTYALVGKTDDLDKGFVTGYADFVWLNFPPAKVVRMLRYDA